LAFFFGFVVALVPFVALLPLVDSETLAPFVAALDPFVVASEVVGSDVVVLDPFLAPFIAADLAPFVADDLDPFVLACAARIAKNSCLLEQPDAAKIRLIVGDDSSSSSMVAREDGGVCDMEKAIELFVRTFFLVTYGLSAVLRRRRGGAVPCYHSEKRVRSLCFCGEE